MIPSRRQISYALEEINTPNLNLSGWTAKYDTLDMTARKKSRAADQRPRHKWLRQGQPIAFDRLIQSILDDFFKEDPAARLRLLATNLAKHSGAARSKVLAKQLQQLAIAYEHIDQDWGTSGLDELVRFFIDSHIERMLPRILKVMLHQLNVEGLLTDTQSPVHYQEHMRLAAGLSQRMSQATEVFITDIYSVLVSADRKKRNKVSPGGKTSPLKQYSHALCFHYERLHPVWRTVKSIYKKSDNRRLAQKTVLEKFSDLGKGERWSITPERIGLPPKLLDLVEAGDPYEGSAECLAYKHAALLCGFQIGRYTVKQLKRIVAEHKKMMGVEYYNSTFKTKNT